MRSSYSSTAARLLRGRPPAFCAPHCTEHPLTVPPSLRRGSIKAGLDQIKAAIGADHAFKAGEEERAVDALASYRQAVELLDPSNEAIAALPEEDREKLAEKRAQALKRIRKLEKVGSGTPVLVPPLAAAAAARPCRRGSIKAGLDQIKAAIEADHAFTAGEEERAVDALASYRQAVELLDPSNEAIAALPEEDREKVAEKRAQALKRIRKLEKAWARAATALLPQPGVYKLLQDCRVFSGLEPDAVEKDYELDDGEIFQLLEAAVDADGTIKMRSTDGWVAYLGELSGEPVLVDSDEAAGESSMLDTMTSSVDSENLEPEESAGESEVVHSPAAAPAQPTMTRRGSMTGMETIISPTAPPQGGWSSMKRRGSLAGLESGSGGLALIAPAELAGMMGQSLDTAIARMPSVMFTSVDEEDDEAADEEDPDAWGGASGGKLASKRRGSDWIDFAADEPLDDSDDDLGLRDDVLAELADSPAPPAQPTMQRRGSMAGIETIHFPPAAPAQPAQPTMKRRGSISMAGVEMHSPVARRRGSIAGVESLMPVKAGPLMSEEVSSTSADNAAMESLAQPKQAEMPQPEPEPELEPPPSQPQPPQPRWPQPQQQPPVPSPSPQRHSSRYDQQSDQDPWAARARDLGRSASSQLDMLDKLAVRPRTLPPRPTFMDGPSHQEETIAILRAQVHDLHLQNVSSSTRSTVQHRQTTRPVLRSETQRFGMQKRRQLRRPPPSQSRVSSWSSGWGSLQYEDDDTGTLDDYGGPSEILTDWLADLQLVHLASLLNEALGVETVDDLLDLVPADLEELGVKPAQCRRLLRAIESMEGGSDPFAAGSVPSGGRDNPSEGIGGSASSMAAAAEALENARTARDKRARDGATASVWEQGGLCAASPPLRLPKGPVDAVAVAWADAIMGGEDGPAVGRGPCHCEIGVVNRLFSEVKPLLIRRALQQEGIDAAMATQSGYRERQRLSPSQPSASWAGAASRHEGGYAELASRFGSSSQSPLSPPPPLPSGHAPSRGVPGAQLSDPSRYARQRAWLDDRDDEPLRLSPAPAPAPLPSPSLVVGPGIYAQAGVGEDVMLALSATTTQRSVHPAPDVAAAAAASPAAFKPLHSLAMSGGGGNSSVLSDFSAAPSSISSSPSWRSGRMGGDGDGTPPPLGHWAEYVEHGRSAHSVYSGSSTVSGSGSRSASPPLEYDRFASGFSPGGSSAGSPPPPSAAVTRPAQVGAAGGVPSSSGAGALGRLLAGV